MNLFNVRCSIALYRHLYYIFSLNSTQARITVLFLSNKVVAFQYTVSKYMELHVSFFYIKWSRKKVNNKYLCASKSCYSGEINIQ